MKKYCFMNVNNKDIRILEHIVSYCVQIEEAVERFGRDEKIFIEDAVYHNAIALCILQIGELAGNLSDEFRRTYADIPWREIKLMRNIVAHKYGTVDYSITWEVVINDIPVLKGFCSNLIMNKANFQ